MLKNNRIPVLYSVVFERFLVVHQRPAIESNHNFRGWKTAFHLTESLEVLQLQVLGYIQDEDIVRERRYSHFHGEIHLDNAQQTEIWQLANITSTHPRDVKKQR